METTVTYYMVLLQHLQEGTEEKVKKPLIIIVKWHEPPTVSDVR
jgi:hypothetical protein